MDLKQIHKIISEGDPNLPPEDEAYKAQMVLLASAEVGPHVRRISRFTGLPYTLVQKFGHFLRKSGVWRGSKIHASWTDKDGWVSFLLDTNVALGFMERKR